MSTTRERLVLGIETSCDETSCAVVGSSGTVYSNVVSSQWELLHKNRGVMPSEAAREHQIKIQGIFDQSLEEANVSMSDITDIAVTAGPGLAPCLDVGLSFAKQVAEKHNFSRIIAVNHLEAHILISRMNSPSLRFPFLALLVSGGHTALLLVKGVGDYHVFGQTLDDALGEAYDKMSRFLEIEPAFGQSYGAAVEEAAARGCAYRFLSEVSTPLKMHGKSCTFSYSGLKSCVRRIVQKIKTTQQELDEQTKCDLAAAFQERALGLVERNIRNALRETDEAGISVSHLVVCGGVACNGDLQRRMHKFQSSSMGVIVPPPMYCQDNAAMIGWAGIEKAALGHNDALSVGYNDRWPLG